MFHIAVRHCWYSTVQPILMIHINRALKLFQKTVQRDRAPAVPAHKRKESENNVVFWTSPGSPPSVPYSWFCEYVSSHNCKINKGPHPFWPAPSNAKCIEELQCSIITSLSVDEVVSGRCKGCLGFDNVPKCPHEPMLIPGFGT